MKQLNGISLINYAAYDNEVTFSLDTDDVQAVVALSGQTLIVTNGEDEVERFDGYKIVQFKDEITYVQARFMRKLDDATAEAIKSLEANVRTARAVADEASAVAQEAKDTASQAGTNPQLQALATLQVSTMSFDKTPCDEVVKFVGYWPEWKPDMAYKHNDPITYQGRKFRASKDLTSQAIYPPGTAESEYYEVTLAPDGIIVWYNVGGEYNMVYKGEKRHYPDAGGPVYEALENTSYSPDAYQQHWKKIEGE